MDIKPIKIGVFVLITILIVIVGYFIYAVFIPDYHVKIKSTIRMFETAVYKFHNKYNRFPTDNEGLTVLIEFLDEKTIPKDPWGNPYIYIQPGPDNLPFEIYSCGRDGIGGNQDDFTSWGDR